MGRETNRPINFFDAQYMVDNEGFTALQTIPGSNKCMTRAEIETYINADSANFSSYTSNRLVPYNLLISTGDITKPVFQYNGFNTGLYISDEGQNSLLCHWKVIDNIEVTSHRIYYRIGTGAWSSVLWTHNEVDDYYDYTLNGLSAGTTYEVYVRSYDDAGNFTDSTSDSKATIGAADTTAPIWKSTTLTVTGETASSIGLSWTGATDDVGITGYSVWKHEGATGTFTLHASLAGNILSYNVTGLSSDTQYVFYVKATDAAGNTSNTDTASQYTTGTAAATYSVSLGRASLSSNACSASTQTYYTNNSDWLSATELYSRSTGTFASSDYYSDGISWRYWDGNTNDFTTSGLCGF